MAFCDESSSALDRRPLHSQLTEQRRRRNDQEVEAATVDFGYVSDRFQTVQSRYRLAIQRLYDELADARYHKDSVSRQVDLARQKGDEMAAASLKKEMFRLAQVISSKEAERAQAVQRLQRASSDYNAARARLERAKFRQIVARST